MPRLLCPHCLRPQTTCICRFVTPIASTGEVLILQHPLEEHHAKNSARLLHLSLPGSRLVVGEVFDDATLRALLPEAPFGAAHAEGLRVALDDALADTLRDAHGL